MSRALAAIASERFFDILDRRAADPSLEPGSLGLDDHPWRPVRGPLATAPGNAGVGVLRVEADCRVGVSQDGRDHGRGRCQPQ